MSYAWNFGDTTSGTGVNPSRTYTTAGTYTVVLTVTDNQGATDTETHTVTVTAPVGPVAIATDNFGRTQATGLGTADLGGAWTSSGTASNYSVSAGTAKIVMPTAGAGRSSYLNSVSARDVNATVDVTLDKAATGGGTFVSLAARRTGTSEYRARIKYLTGGTIQLYIGRIVNGTESTLQIVNIPGITVAPGDVLRLRFEVSGTTTATLNAKVWRAGTTEPAAWQNTITDTTPTLNTAGGIGIIAYTSGTTTNTPITATIDNLNVTTI